MEEARYQSDTRIKARSFRKEDGCSESSHETTSSRESFENLTSSSEDDKSPPDTAVGSKTLQEHAKSTKKRPLPRKEIQRRYRERQKLKKQIELGSAIQVDDEVALLVEENIKLQEERLALLAGLNQANMITEFLENCRLSNAAANASASASTEVHFPFSPNNPNEIADALFSNALHGYEPSEYLIHKYAELPPSLLVERDRSHFPLVLDTMMAEWYSTYSTRDETTIKLKRLFDTRVRIAIKQNSPPKMCYCRRHQTFSF
jgi:hypothetical protein